ncbi:MAG: hypothetical protein Q9191_005078 [Dirinaria sp. TL-2023a]
MSTDMPLLWVQYWTALPVLVEDGEMNDGNHLGGRLPPGTYPVDPSLQYRVDEDPNPSPNSSVGASHNIISQAPASQQHYGPDQSYTTSEYSANQFAGQMQPHGPFSMLGMAGALPEYQASKPSHAPQPGQQRQHPAHTATNLGYQVHQIPHYADQNSANPSSHASLPPQYATPYQQATTQAFAQQHPGQAPHLRSNPGPANFSGGPYFTNPQPQAFSYFPGQYGQTVQPQSAGRAHPNVSSGVIPSSPRGPPRKPKQSGHALWVGNLPSGALVTDLKDHFSKDATLDIESVFLISKSNCAFVNYRTDAACAAAMTRFHDSRFHSVRLVCRLRRTSTASVQGGVPLGPAALMPTLAQSQTAAEAIAQNREVSSRAEELAKAEMLRDGEAPPAKHADKYFIMKSLTVEDMELSVRNSIWATQGHNEDALNKAFETTENVYLVFSANKSGEYFGFARMASPISEEAAKDLDWAPKTEAVVDDPDLPRSIVTPATETAPRGRIIDDSARGTIFWEADPVDTDTSQDTESELEDHESDDETEEQQPLSETQAYGRPFKIEWLSNNRLPFYRTRGLRNPWNANREVKIARDGTELETSVGRRLIQMFQKMTPIESPVQPQMPWPPSRSG